MTPSSAASSSSSPCSRFAASADSASKSVSAPLCAGWLVFDLAATDCLLFCFFFAMASTPEAVEFNRQCEMSAIGSENAGHDASAEVERQGRPQRRDGLNQA